ncbi:hypothetical protein FPQ18DRAFT_55491 [Pyronema domesticum]|nr:hypothetical protein FPQ18DRAFT_55491 [Pyronema domesticum]
MDNCLIGGGGCEDAKSMLVIWVRLCAAGIHFQSEIGNWHKGHLLPRKHYNSPQEVLEVITELPNKGTTPHTTAIQKKKKKATLAGSRAFGIDLLMRSDIKEMQHAPFPAEWRSRFPHNSCHFYRHRQASRALHHQISLATVCRLVGWLYRSAQCSRWAEVVLHTLSSLQHDDFVAGCTDVHVQYDRSMREYFRERQGVSHWRNPHPRIQLSGSVSPIKFTTQSTHHNCTVSVV